MKIPYKPGYFITPKDAANILNVSLSYVYKLIKEGNLKAVQVGKRKRIYYPDFIKFIESHLIN